MQNCLSKINYTFKMTDTLQLLLLIVIIDCSIVDLIRRKKWLKKKELKKHFLNL